MFKNVQNLDVVKEETSSKAVVFSYAKLKIISSFFCLLLCFNILGIYVPIFGISAQIKQVTASWVPNLSDIGKLKFVDTQTEKEVLAEIDEIAMPFENTYIQQTSAGEFLVNGLGGLIVRCCFDGKVQKIENIETDAGLKKTVTISHKRGIKSVYEGLDTVGVKEGDAVTKNMALGICENSEIKFKIFFRNRLITGLTVKDGQMSFE